MTPAESPSTVKQSHLGRYRIILMLAVTLITGSYLWLEIGVISNEFFHNQYLAIHWGFAGLIWLIGVAGIQYGYRRLAVASHELLTERNNLLAIFDNVQVGMLLIDQQMNVVRVNQGMRSLFDRNTGNREGTRHGIILRCPNALANPLGCGHSPGCDSCGLMLALRQALQDGISTLDGESQLLSDYGDETVRIWALYSVKPITRNGERLALLSIMDISGRREAEKLLHMQKERYRALVENLPDVIIRYDRDGRRLYMNQVYERLLGDSAIPLIGKTPAETPVFGAVLSAQIQHAVSSVVQSGKPKEVELVIESGPAGEERYYLADFVPEFDAEGETASVLCIARDITDLRVFQDELKNMAFLDPLTNLPNRSLFNDRLNQHMAESQRGAQTLSMGIMLLDLDGFKSVNDTMGHEVGDRLLQKVGKRIRRCLRDQDTVARMGGDEFALILPEIRHELDLAIVARKILTAIEAPFEIEGKELFITTSIGIACYPSDSVDVSELVRFADMAMYHAKRMGRNNYQFYAESLTRDSAERMELENDLRKALQHGELELYYQPKVDTIIGQLVGAEALLRWNHPLRGLVPPDRFIGIAEDTGLITGIGEWVLETACRTVRQWNHDAQYPLKVAVNLSARQFMTGDLKNTVCAVLARTGCKAQWLELEITESLLMAGRPEIASILESLDSLGISIAIDDFGTGYSALSYLTDFPVSVIKVDKAFVRDITTSTKSLELAKAIISLGHALGLELVAEGVESSDQAVCLDRLGCHIIQGYLYGKPMPLKRFDEWQTEFCDIRQSQEEDPSGLLRVSWRDYLTTGNEMIDSQHRELFRRITGLTLACREGKGREEVARLLDYLDGYIKSHFSAEEELLLSTGSPHYAEHKVEHGNFSETIRTLRSRLSEDGENSSLIVETNHVAVEWLTRHICSMDRELAERAGRAAAERVRYDSEPFVSSACN